MKEMPHVAALRRLLPNANIDTVLAVEAEIARAKAKHPGDFHNHHEAFAVLNEEVDELWDTVKQDQPVHRKREELIQVAAMAFRWLNELCPSKNETE